jgi:hypothetical protein
MRRHEFITVLGDGHGVAGDGAHAATGIAGDTSAANRSTYPRTACARSGQLPSGRRFRRASAFFDRAKTASRKRGIANDGTAGKSTDFSGHPPKTRAVPRICASVSK